MSKKTSGTETSGRNASSGRFVSLKDGRKLVVPPAGGKLKKTDIKKAIRLVVDNRQKTKTPEQNGSAKTG